MVSSQQDVTQTALPVARLADDQDFVPVLHVHVGSHSTYRCTVFGIAAVACIHTKDSKGELNKYKYVYLRLQCFSN